MLCCKGNKPPSKPVARGAAKPDATQDAATPTLLADPTGVVTDKTVAPIKESHASLTTETAAAVPLEDVEKKPETSAEQHASQEAEPPSSTLPVSSEPDQSRQTEKVSSGTHSSGLLRKQRTVTVDKNELDVMVVEYSCHDSSVLTALGKHSKEAKWKVQVGHDTDPVDIALHVDQGVLSGPAVKISSNGKTVFQTAGSYTTKAMYEDFQYRWPFRGTIKGMNESGMFELRPHAIATNEWFPATITGQREDGLFEVMATMPDNLGSLTQVSYPAVDKADLREASTRQPLHIPARSLTLQVPRDHPLQACLKLDGKDLVTHHFAWPSPSRTSDDHPLKERQLRLCVAKDRSRVTGNLGHSTLTHFVTGGVRAVSSDIQTMKHSWTLKVGPFAEHTVTVEKKHRLSKIISLSVDGQPFVEASAEDIDCETEGWECKFRFVGERIIDFEVHESNRDGVTLDSKDHVLQKNKYVHECCVTLGDDLDAQTAVFTIDSQDFRELPVHSEAHEEDSISISPEALNAMYGILVPYKVNHKAPCGIFGLSATPRGAPKMGRRAKTMCCC